MEVQLSMATISSGKQRLEDDGRTEECRIRDWILSETGSTRNSWNSVLLEELWSSRELAANSGIDGIGIL
ncbi:hypothetical protein NL676_029776 [Syzygium grande]|nr:hypothetical protein NL676_029776 [Syzygium grande]